MARYSDNLEAYILAKHYNLLPDMQVYPSRIRNTNSGKFEPDRLIGEPVRCMLLAHFSGASNVLIKYEPENLKII